MTLYDMLKRNENEILMHINYLENENDRMTRRITDLEKTVEAVKQSLEKLK